MAESGPITGARTYLGDFIPGQRVAAIWQSLTLVNVPSTIPDGTLRVISDTDDLNLVPLTADDGTTPITKDDDTEALTSDEQTETALGITYTVDYLGVIGLRRVEIDTSVDEAFFVAGHDYYIVWDTTTTGGLAISLVIASFSVCNRSLTAPVAELTAVPSHPTSVMKMVQMLFALFAHKRTQTSTTGRVYKSDSSTVLGTRTNGDDGTTFTDGKLS